MATLCFIRTTLPCLTLGLVLVAVTASSAFALTRDAARKMSKEELRIYVEGGIDMAIRQARVKGKMNTVKCITGAFYGSGGDEKIGKLVSNIKSPIGDHGPDFYVLASVQATCK